MYHLRSRVRLLIVVRHGYGVELRHGVVAAQYAGGVFPRDGRACLHLRPREFRRLASQVSALGDEVEYSSLAVLVAGVPVLHGGVLHLGAVLDDNLHDGGVELVLVALRCGASLEVRDVCVVVGNDERAFKLSCARRIDAEVAGQLHGAAYALRDVDERAVGEHCGVEGGEEVVAVWHYAAQILAHQVGVLLYGLSDGHEDDALLLESLLVCCLDGDGVHDGIDGDTAQCQTLLKGYAEFVERLLQFGVYLFRSVLLLCQRVGVV